MRSLVRPLSPALTALFVGVTHLTPAQVPASPATSLISAPVDNAQRVVLLGNTRPEATAANDLGLVSDSMPLSHLQLVLKRSPAQSAALEQILAAQADPASPKYHNWLSNDEIATQFGASSEDVDKVNLWLGSQGFSIDAVSLAQGVVTFSGTAGLVRTAFHTPLHNIRGADGRTHFANVNDPEIPAALAPALQGIAALHDFMPKPMLKTKVKPVVEGYSAKYGTNYLSAGDLAKIYNFDSLYNNGLTGKGQTIVVIEDTDLYGGTNDWNTFREAFGLTARFPNATLVETHPSGKSACAAPGVNGASIEAAVDVEWATAAAPEAAIVNAACADTRTQFGGFLALSNLLEEQNPPKVVSISYGEAESDLGSAENAYIYSLYQTAALEGVSVFVSSGDSTAVGNDRGQQFAYHGTNVSGFTSTPFNVSVGGTDFGYIPLHSPGEYFTTTNSPTFVTALSYIPEIPWDNSCGGSILSGYFGYPQTGNNSLCNSLPPSLLYLENTDGGSGGPSGCSIGNATIGDVYGAVISGTCRGYGKPSWQRNTAGNPGDGVRDTPDVSLFAANGVWGSYYALCYSDATFGGVACGADPGNWDGVGGTSVSSPIWAGIQALVNQRTRTSWGNPNPVLYTLGRNQYNTEGNTCDATRGPGGNPHCAFHDVTAGDIAVGCLGRYNCYFGDGVTGVTSTSDTIFRPTYPATRGWDFATGLGTANAFNVVAGFAYYGDRTLTHRLEPCTEGAASIRGGTSFCDPAWQLLRVRPAASSCEAGSFFV